MIKYNKIIVGVKHTMKTIQIMNKHGKKLIWIFHILILMVALQSGAELLAQNGEIYIDPNISNRKKRRRLVMNANNMEMYITNWGTIADAAPFRGIWPKGTQHDHIHEMSGIVAGQVVDKDTNVVTIVSDGYMSGRTDTDPITDIEWGLQPIPGYFQEDPEINIGNTFANSTDSTTWPLFWPGKEAKWNQKWNGYFGLHQFNADQEGYYMMDDLWNSEYNYYPVPGDSSRRGLGLQIEVRAFQWVHPLAQNVIFFHWQVTNIGEQVFNPESAPIYFGGYSDIQPGGQGTIDDNSWFDKDKDMVYAWDNDDIGVWANYRDIPPGYEAWAFLESPGIGNDGIDNDNDEITDEKRDNEAGEYIFGPVGKYGPPVWHYEGDEDGDWNGFDDRNANGEIDEDERIIDDRGTDGSGPEDEGYPGPDLDGTEGNGIPDQGEPNFGKTDNDESDQVGLTSFYAPVYGTIQQGDDEGVWTRLQPGIFETPQQSTNILWIFGSGPFPLEPLHTERFSTAWMFAWDEMGIFRIKDVSQRIYDSDYRFAKPPKQPTVTAVAGDNKVTLIWDRVAEYSRDPIYGHDFEGYKVIKGTDPQMFDSWNITDAFGNVTYRSAVAQYDLANGLKGRHPVELGTLIGNPVGAHYDMGEDSGLKYYWVDDDVDNGMTYYYAVISYDKGYDDDFFERGLTELEFGAAISPSECNSTITLEGGAVVKQDRNIAIVTPNPQSSNYVPGSVDNEQAIRTEGYTSGSVNLQVLNPDQLPDNHIFELSFETQSGIEEGIGIPVAVSYSVRDTTEDKFLIKNIQIPKIFNDDMMLEIPYEWMEFKDLWISPPFSGMILNFQNDVPSVESVLENSDWLPGSQATVGIKIEYANPGNPTLYPMNFYIDFTEEISGKAFKTKSGGVTFDTFFDVISASTGESIPFVLTELLFTRNGKWDKNETLLVGVPQEDGSYLWTWSLKLDFNAIDDIVPQNGDQYQFVCPVPFTTADKFIFSTTASQKSFVNAKSKLDLITVVPNPYVVTERWEQQNPLAGRGERKIQINHLPSECTLRIFTVSGHLVKTIKHQGLSSEGTATWDLSTKDDLEAAPGLYILHIEAPEMGNKLLRFAIIN